MTTTRQRTTRVLTIVVAVALGAFCGTAAAQTYSVTDLSVVSPYVMSQALAINTNGQVTGTLLDAGGTQAQAFFFSSGAIAPLGKMAGTMAYALNDAGTVVGAMSVGAAQTHAFAYTGSYIDLGTFGGLNSYALGINRDGTACGAALNGDGQTHAFTWQGGILYDIHILAQASEFAAASPTGHIIHSTFSEAHDINDSNDVVGFFRAPNSTGVNGEIAFHYRNEVLTELGNLGGTNSRALAINTGGRIVGWSELPSGAKRAVIFYINGNIVPLGTVGPAATWSAAYAVNDAGVVVGASGTSTTDTVAFIYQNGANTDLNTLIPADSGWTLQAATGINTAGRVTGYGLINGQTHAFLLTPGTGPTPGGGTVPGTDAGGICGNGTGLPIALASSCLLAVSFRRRR